MWRGSYPTVRASLRATIGVELDEPTAAYIAARCKIGERFAQRALLAIHDLRLCTIADDDVHRLTRPQLRRRGGLGLGHQNPADVIDVRIVVVERQSEIHECAVLAERGLRGRKPAR